MRRWWLTPSRADRAEWTDKGASRLDAVDLYAAYLGGPPSGTRMGEDHEVVFVVAADPKDAKSRARSKWAGHGRPHVDAVQRLCVVDGYAVTLEPTGEESRTVVELNDFNE